MALGCLFGVHYPPVHVLSLGMFNLCYYVAASQWDCKNILFCFSFYLVHELLSYTTSTTTGFVFKTWIEYHKTKTKVMTGLLGWFCPSVSTTSKKIQFKRFQVACLWKPVSHTRTKTIKRTTQNKMNTCSQHEVQKNVKGQSWVTLVLVSSMIFRFKSGARFWSQQLWSVMQNLVLI